MAVFGMAIKIAEDLSDLQPTKNFGIKKLDKNIERDKVNIRIFKELGWDVLVVWTCEVNDINQLKNKLLSFLEGKAKQKKSYI